MCSGGSGEKDNGGEGVWRERCFSIQKSKSKCLRVRLLFLDEDILKCVGERHAYCRCHCSAMPALLGLLCDPHCRLIQPIRIDLDYIEVLPSGTCFHIPTKSFIVNPNISGSARAFMEYTYKEGVVPFPRFFVEGKLQFVSFCELI